MFLKYWLLPTKTAVISSFMAFFFNLFLRHPLLFGKLISMSLGNTKSDIIQYYSSNSCEHQVAPCV